jgi:hypothetical protein
MAKIIQKWNGIRARLSLELLTVLRLSCFTETTRIRIGTKTKAAATVLPSNSRHYYYANKKYKEQQQQFLGLKSCY